jgi:hypothetical protein
MPTTVSSPGGQVDVFPTIMGLLDRSYMNNTFGIDMFKTKRPYMFFSSDNALDVSMRNTFILITSNRR